MDTGIIPPNLELPLALPRGIKAYRRRFLAPATNVSSAGPDDYVNIYPDTSTPGSFIDPASTYIQFDLLISNSNPFVDYANFGKEGAAGAIIKELRVYNQGSITEEILEYGTVASTMATASGGFETATEFYMSARLKNSYQTENHKNFIKPPNVDSSGNIMFGPNPFGIGACADTTMTQYSTDGAAHSFMMKPISQYSSNGVISVLQGLNDAAPFILNSTNTGPSTNVSTTVYAASNHVTPMDWPEGFSTDQVEPVKSEYVKTYGTLNKPQIMANLVNVKCIPIGMVPAKNAYNGNLGPLVPGTCNASATPTAPTLMIPRYRICAPIISGIFGTLATKMLATCLLSPQQLYLNLKLASAGEALQLSSDPCRRIPGTIRDYVRNVGSLNKSPYGNNFFSPTVGGVGASITPFNFEANTYCAPGYGGVLAINSSFPANTIYNAASASGRNTGRKILIKELLPGLTTVANSNTISYTTVGQLKPGDTIFHPVVLPFGARVLTVPTTTSATLSQQPLAVVVADDGGRVVIEGDYMQLPATPQYALVTEPWKFKGNGIGSEVVYATENSVFYGTYLPASVPQTARIFQCEYGKATPLSAQMPEYSPQKGIITYSIENISLVGDQIILPNEVTADIIQQASRGGFNVHTNSVRTYVMQPTKSTTQSIIMPFKVSQAKRIFLSFQATAARNSSTGFLYNSNCGFNPFGSVELNSENKDKASNGNGYINGGTVATSLVGVGYKSPLVYNSIPVSSVGSSISVQMRIGNEFYPQQPMTTMQEIAAEFNKTLDGWGDASFSPELDSTIIHVNNTPYFDCTRPDKYTTTFIPQELLDDQTITNNFDMAPLYSYSPTMSTTASTDPTNLAGATATSPMNGYNSLPPRGYCVQGTFCSPSSSFILGFNLSPFPESQGIDSGTYLGNNVITLLLNGAIGLNNDLYNTRMVGVIPHRAVLRYAAGGQIIWNY